MSATGSKMERAHTPNAYLLRSALVAALGGLLFGFDTAVISGTTRALTDQFSLSAALLGFTVSAALWGTVLGSILAGTPADRYGRRVCLAAVGALYVISALGCALAWNWYVLIGFRVVGGLAIGASSVIGPMYIAEISPALRRGRLVGMFQLNVVAGILLAYLSNYLVSLAGLGPVEWRWKLGVASVPAAAFFVALFRIPESPRWLLGAGKKAESLEVLRHLGEPDPDREGQEISESLQRERAGRRERLFQKRYRKPVFLSISIGIFNQLSGINAILYYLNDIFERAGFNRISGEMQAVAIGFTNLVFTLIAMAVIDRLGRKKLLLTGAAGTAFCLGGVAALFATGMKWVKTNIAKFGGDPSRVTIFGESAGGIAVSMLCASPAAKGLFQGAISESGGNFGPGRIDNGAAEGGVTMVPLKMAEASGHQFLEKLGVNDIKSARELSADKIQAGLGQGAQTRFWPVFDGKILPSDQYELYEAGHFNDTPVLVGTNSDEGASFARPGVTKASFEEQVRAGYGKQADATLAAYPHATDEEAMQSRRDLFRDSVFAWPTWAWASLQSQKGKGKAYIYYFDHKTPRTPHGAQHAAEIGYVFHNLGGRGPAPEPENIAVSDLMSAYWTNFAKNGNPNGGSGV